jgi:hypothetical protein
MWLAIAIALFLLFAFASNRSTTDPSITSTGSSTLEIKRLAVAEVTCFNYAFGFISRFVCETLFNAVHHSLGLHESGTITTLLLLGILS